MADYGFDKMIKVAFSSTIADISAPKLTELNAAGTIALDPHLRMDGLTVTADTASVDNSRMNSDYDTELAGRRKLTLGVKYIRGDSTAQIAIAAALVYKANGFLIVRRDKSSDVAWAVGDKVEVYPCQVGELNPDAPAANTLQAVEVPLMSTLSPRSLSNPATVVA